NTTNGENMETVALILGALNLVLVTALLLAVLSRGRGAGVSPELRAELQAQRVELRQTVIDAQAQTDARLQAGAQAQAAELARDRETRVLAERGQAEQLTASLQGLRATLEQRFDVLRSENEAKLEQMRVAVDDKLQSTLKAALDENATRI